MNQVIKGNSQESGEQVNVQFLNKPGDGYSPEESGKADDYHESVSDSVITEGSDVKVMSSTRQGIQANELFQGPSVPDEIDNSSQEVTPIKNAQIADDANNGREDYGDGAVLDLSNEKLDLPFSTTDNQNSGDINVPYDEITKNELEEQERLIAKRSTNSLESNKVKEENKSEDLSEGLNMGVDNNQEELTQPEMNIESNHLEGTEGFADNAEREQNFDKQFEEILGVIKETSAQLDRKSELLSALRDQLNAVTNDVTSVLEGGTPDALKNEVSELEETVSNLHGELGNNTTKLKALIQKDPNILTKLRNNESDILDIKMIKDLVDSMQNITPIQESTKDIEEMAEGKIIMERSGSRVLDDIANAIIQLTEMRGETISDDEAVGMAGLAYEQYLNKAIAEFKNKISPEQFTKMVKEFSQGNGGKFTLELSSNGPVFDIVDIRNIIANNRNSSEGFDNKERPADDYGEQIAA